VTFKAHLSPLSMSFSGHVLVALIAASEMELGALLNIEFV